MFTCVAFKNSLPKQRFAVALWICCGILPFIANGRATGDESQVGLDRTETFGVSVKNTLSRSMWRREVMRQALLLAARAEMHLPTADVVLGEEVALDVQRTLELTCKPGAPNTIELLQGPLGKRAPVWAHEFKDARDWPPHRFWVERMETLSRTGFIEALEKAKFERRTPPVKKDSALTDAVAELDPELLKLIDDDLSFTSQFLALRQLHAELGSTDIQSSGFSELL